MSSTILIILVIYLGMGLPSAVVLIAACVLSARFEARLPHPVAAVDPDGFGDAFDASSEAVTSRLEMMGWAEVFAIDPTAR